MRGSKKLLVWAILISMLIGMVGCGNKGTLSGEEFWERMEKAGMTADPRVRTITSTEPAPYYMYRAENKDVTHFGASLYIYQDTDVFKAADLVEEQFKMFSTIANRGEEGWEVIEQTDTKFAVWFPGEDGERRYWCYSKVENTIMEILVPESELKNMKKVLKDTGYLE